MKHFAFSSTYWQKQKPIVMEKQEENTVQVAKELAKKLEPLIRKIKRIHDDAIVVYTPLVEDLCSRKATENEVGWMLNWLLMYAGDERMLLLFKQVCRTYLEIYPASIAFYIMEYKKEYEPESPKGTEYEYLLNEDENEEG